MATNNPDAKLFDPTAGNGRNYEMTAPTRDEVLAMARDVGGSPFGQLGGLDIGWLERFHALAVAPYKEDAERLQEMFSLLASAWFYGGWKAETANEREMQRIMTTAGWWPIENEDELIAKIDRARSAK